ncbi:hypothetical protein ARC20_10955 [Stenotrophomonas panacihumi]|uniref:Zinc ribbon domain-containing protein n=1 Tax=Stenotrophomonas panacihumi TaxID=676599 RepID=A0A0R0ABS8_9GAMM|nr:hypothetical protein [Stenotrophomonas panacihumi]KRG42380.1 hypothetical protein ARC20_10955 [Stenotrophomonas panacihumi]PTN54479.1 hypothetical protein C9J98_09545 [Stenotrophomonas panacihumi]
MPPSPDLPLDDLMPWLFALWVAVGLAALAFFRHTRNARLKRGVWIALMLGADAVFLGVVWATGAPWYFFALALGVVAIGTRRSLAMTRFCDACGGNHFPMDGQTAPTTCRHCGADLQAARPPTVH